jgi:hypothetical protein
MNRLLLHLGSSLILVMVSLNINATSTPANAQELDVFIPNEVVVKLRQISDVAGIAAGYGLDPIPLAQFGSRAIFRMRIIDGAAPPDRAAELVTDLRVVYAEPNFIGQAPEGKQRVSWAKGGGVEEYQGQWAGNIIRLPEAHTVTKGDGILVAVLDTGVDLTHPALVGRLVEGFDFVDLDTDPSEVGVPEQNVVYGHGTHVAGLIALVAPDAKIMPLRVLDSDGVGNIWVIAEALAYAVNPDGDLNTNDGADVINLSLSTEHSTHLLTEVQNGLKCSDEDEKEEEVDCLAGPGQNGAVVVAAAGNSGSSTPEYPAAEGIAGSLAVAASTSADTLALFSNFGNWVHVAAPGEGILSSIPGGEYAVWSGTSMSTPLVAGEAALVRAADPLLDATEVAERIIETSFVITAPVQRRIDVAAALGIALMHISGEYRCSGELGRVAVDNLLIGPGQTCTLVGTRIGGNIKIESGGALNAMSIYVKGNIQAKGATTFSLSNSTVDGSLQVEESGPAQLHASQVNGNVKFVKNTNSLTISNNTIQGNLQCKENMVIPVGGSNVVRGNKEDQCAVL